MRIFFLSALFPAALSSVANAQTKANQNKFGKIEKGYPNRPDAEKIGALVKKCGGQ